jgi:hypothetical protein
MILVKITQEQLVLVLLPTGTATNRYCYQPVLLPIGTATNLSATNR